MAPFDAERWKRIDALMDKALDLPEDERDAFLDQECADEPDLRKEVGRMLNAGEKAGTFLEGGAPAPVRALREAMDGASTKEDTEMAGERVGPYRIIRRVGKGGMGQVFLAVRDDESYTRYVALKIIRRGMDTEEILKRFKIERRILASLTHPNIARLLDGGATDEGLSYFVMEYIDGVPVTEYCDTHRLGVRERLQIFRKIAGAVHYAHQNLIVHRDLKPSNILVTGEGEPRLLDFGIAKFLNPNLAGYTVPMTRTEMRVMTPEYASPEQMRGGSVTTASDVYQLGVLLYELLTGTRPHRTEGRTRKEIEQIVLDQEPEPPSTAIGHVDPERLAARTRSGRDETTDRARSGSAFDHLRRILSGDLDRIVLMALRKETDRRYQSADQLAEDIRRYLEGLPVAAQKDTWSYRASKFVRRHRAGVVAASAVGLLLIAVTAVSIRFAIVSNQQKQQIAVAAAEAEEVTSFLVDLFQVSDPENARGREVTALELLERGVSRIDSELDGQPQVQASLLNVMGAVNTNLGLYEEADNLLTRSLAMRRAEFGTAHPAVAESLFELAVLRDWQGDYDEAEQMHREALEIRRAELGQEHPKTAESLSSLAAVIAYQGRVEESEALLEQARDLLDRVYDEDHEDKGEVLSNLGWIYHEQERYPEAEDAYREALRIHRAMLGPDHPYVGSTANNLAALLYDTGRFDEAAPMFRDVLRLRTELYGEDHGLVANSIGWLGRVLRQTGALDEAEPLLRQALERHVAVFGEDHMAVARDRHELAELLLARLRASDEAQEPLLAEAEEQLIGALSVYRQVFDNSEERLIVDARDDLATVYALWGREDRSNLY